jgi:hypothetical protein
MLDRLSGYQRLGFVSSIAWILLVLLTAAAELSGFSQLDTPLVQHLSGVEPSCGAPGPPLDEGKEFWTDEEVWGCAPGTLIPGTDPKTIVRWDWIAFWTVLPVLCAWFLVLAFVRTFRWVAAGFRGAAP